MSSLWIAVSIFIKSVISRSQTPEATWEAKARFVSSLQVISVVVSKINLFLQTDKVSDQEFLCCCFNDFIDFRHKYLSIFGASLMKCCWKQNCFLQQPILPCV